MLETKTSQNHSFPVVVQVTIMHAEYILEATQSTLLIVYNFLTRIKGMCCLLHPRESMRGLLRITCRSYVTIIKRNRNPFRDMKFLAVKTNFRNFTSQSYSLHSINSSGDCYIIILTGIYYLMDLSDKSLFTTRLNS